MMKTNHGAHRIGAEFCNLIYRLTAEVRLYCSDAECRNKVAPVIVTPEFVAPTTSDLCTQSQTLHQFYTNNKNIVNILDVTIY